MMRRTETKEEASADLCKIALPIALVGLLFIVLWASVPLWVPSAYSAKFSALFLASAFAFASLAVFALVNAWVLRRNLK